MALEFLRRRQLPPVDETFSNHRHELGRFAQEFVDLYYDPLVQRAVTKDLENIYLSGCNTIANNVLPIDQADTRKRLLGLLKGFWDARDFAENRHYDDARDSVHEAFGEANAGHGGAELLDANRRVGNQALRAIRRSERPLFGLDRKLADLSDRFSTDADIATRPEDRYAFIVQEFPFLSEELRELHGLDVVSLAETLAKLVKRERATYPHSPSAWSYLDEHLSTLLHIRLESIEKLIQRTDLDDVYERVHADPDVQEARMLEAIDAEYARLGDELARDRFAVIAYQSLRICANTPSSEERRRRLTADLEQVLPAQTAEEAVTYMGSLAVRDVRDLLAAQHPNRFYDLVRHLTDDIKHMEAEGANETETAASWQATANRLKDEIRKKSGDISAFSEQEHHRLIGTQDARVLSAGLDLVQNIWNRVAAAYAEVQDTREPTIQELVEYLALERAPRLEHDVRDTERRLRDAQTAERDLIIENLPSARALLNESGRWHAALRELRTQLGSMQTDAVGRRSDSIAHEWLRRRREGAYQHDPSEPFAAEASLNAA